jgi:hypothetical protein
VPNLIKKLLPVFSWKFFVSIFRSTSQHGGVWSKVISAWSSSLWDSRVIGIICKHLEFFVLFERLYSLSLQNELHEASSDPRVRRVSHHWGLESVGLASDWRSTGHLGGDP